MEKAALISIVAMTAYEGTFDFVAQTTPDNQTYWPEQDSVRLSIL